MRGASWNIRVTRSSDGYEVALEGPDGLAATDWRSVGPIRPGEVLRELSKRGCLPDAIREALTAADRAWMRAGGSGPDYAELWMQDTVRNRVDSSSPITPGWRFVDIGFEMASTQIAKGINPWEVTWLSLYDRIVVAHPQYPAQRHDMETYQVAGTDPPVVFAAGEFSNGVWGFYVPLEPPGDVRPR